MTEILKHALASEKLRLIAIIIESKKELKLLKITILFCCILTFLSAILTNNQHVRFASILAYVILLAFYMLKEGKLSKQIYRSLEGLKRVNQQLASQMRQI